IKFLILLVFFFSSRRRHTRSKRDWSSDVCSSDLYNFDNAVYTKKLHDITNYVVNDREDHQQKVVIYIHGGAWFQDPLPYHFEYIDMLATAFDAKVIMPIYPKIP